MMNNTATKMLMCARKFVLVERNTKLSQPIQSEVAIEWRSEGQWAIIIDGHDCLNKAGELEYEPSPSNRDDEFLERTRYSLEDAWDMAVIYAQNNGFRKFVFEK